MKLVVRERESDALERFVDATDIPATSIVSLVEVPRAVRRSDPEAHARALEALQRIEIITADDEVLELAARLDPPILSSIDALHLASAMNLRIDVFVTYDRRLADAARRAGREVESPA